MQLCVCIPIKIYEHKYSYFFHYKSSKSTTILCSFDATHDVGAFWDSFNVQGKVMTFALVVFVVVVRFVFLLFVVVAVVKSLFTVSP